jgi:anti-sigma factor ChrR (cupin superfamily)
LCGGSINHVIARRNDEAISRQGYRLEYAPGFASRLPRSLRSLAMTTVIGILRGGRWKNVIARKNDDAISRQRLELEYGTSTE